MNQENTNQMKTLINLTPHSIKVVGFMELPPSGTQARVSTDTKTANETINGIPLFEISFGEVKGLPEPKKDTIFVVSTMVRTHPQCLHRTDVVSPGELVRDELGNIIGCLGFVQNTPQKKITKIFAPDQVLGILEGPETALQQITIL